MVSNNSSYSLIPLIPLIPLIWFILNKKIDFLFKRLTTNII